jgi:hypothetical protein
LKHIECHLTSQGPKLIFDFRRMLFILNFKQAAIFDRPFLFKENKKGG